MNINVCTVNQLNFRRIQQTLSHCNPQNVEHGVDTFDNINDNLYIPVRNGMNLTRINTNSISSINHAIIDSNNRNNDNTNTSTKNVDPNDTIQEEQKNIENEDNFVSHMENPSSPIIVKLDELINKTVLQQQEQQQQQQQSQLNIASNDMSLSSFLNLRDHLIGRSCSLLIDQSRIDSFSVTTLDYQYIHQQSSTHEKNSPFHDKPIAHGFLLLSLSVYLLQSLLPALDGVVMTINYGIERLRFIKPVPVNSQIYIKLVIKQTEMVQKSKKSPRLTSSHPVELEVKGKNEQLVNNLICYESRFYIEMFVEGQSDPKPYLVFEWITRMYIQQ